MYNKALLSQAANEARLEMDLFDPISLHIGTFQNDRLVGCSRLTQPKSLSIFLERERSLKDARRREQIEFDERSLPSSAFLEDRNLLKLEYFLEGIKFSGKRFSEAGRFIHTSNTFNPRLVAHMLGYIWALNAYYEIDYCFFNTTKAHAKYYTRLFGCKAILPELRFNTGAKSEKYFLYADIKNPPRTQFRLIKKILDAFEKNEGPAAISIKHVLKKAS
ncbi:MAG: hypothetical protein R8P61_32240 [Bacteroidia bacterium]|nr:hypothetical protein [Bacteroidia bacterium]